MWHHQQVILNVDNTAAVTMCNKGCTKCKHLGAMICNIWMVTEMWDIKLGVMHIPGKQYHTGDILSRLCKDTTSKVKLHALMQDPIFYDIDQSYFEVNYHIYVFLLIVDPSPLSSALLVRVSHRLTHAYR